eukprot:1143115-Prymnesium_polylepis.1
MAFCRFLSLFGVARAMVRMPRRLTRAENQNTSRLSCPFQSSLHSSANTPWCRSSNGLSRARLKRA